jgi:hypothetical protein
VIALKSKFKFDGSSWPHQNGKRQPAIPKDAIGERGLHLFAPTSASAPLWAVLLENQKRRIALSFAVGRWDVKGPLPAASDVLEDLSVCGDCDEK